MDVIDYLKPRFVLMENVVDLYRLRFFVWGARPSETLPPFPLPRHDVIKRDAIFDLPPVTNFEKRDEIPYEGDALENMDEIPYNGQALTDFQRVIRLSKNETLALPSEAEKKALLYDHRPVHVSLISWEKGCNILAKGCNMWYTSNILGKRMQYPREMSACFTNILGERVQSSRKGASFTNILGERVRVSEGACFERVQYPRKRRKDAISSRKGAICGALLISSEKGCNILAKGVISSRKGACFTNILGERVLYPRKRVHVSLISSDFACNMWCTSNILGERMQYPRKRVRVSLISSEKGCNILAKWVQYPRERVRASLISSEKGCNILAKGCMFH
ncbi:hypothetical protein ACFE04_027428 [Oxalis oulophora]